MSSTAYPEERRYTVRIHDEGDEGLWAEVEELPGCFASGSTREELEDSLAEGVGLYLSSEVRPARAKLIGPHPSFKGDATETLRFFVS